MTSTTERQQFAEQNEMSLEFVNWFFDEKKESFGNMWFLMAAALWEGWKGRDNREAQPELSKFYEKAWKDGYEVGVATAPPAPALPEEAKVGEMPFLGNSEPGFVRGWNACRAAMLAAAPEGGNG